MEVESPAVLLRLNKIFKLAETSAVRKKTGSQGDRLNVWICGPQTSSFF